MFFPWPPNYRYPSLPNDYPPCPAAQLGTCALSLRNLHGNLKKNHRDHRKMVIYGDFTNRNGDFMGLKVHLVSSICCLSYLSWRKL